MTTRVNRLFKISLLAAGMLLVFYSFSFTSKSVHANSSGPAPSLTGAPAFGSIPAETTCNDCHATFPLNSGPGLLKVLGLPSSYTPGQDYTVTVSLNQANRLRYGFQVTALDATGKPAGTLTVTDATATRPDTAPVGGFTRTYISQTSSGYTATSTNQRDWSFKWTAPATRVGKITFYAAGNAANGTGSSSGDYIYNVSASMTPSVVSVSSADYNSANPVAAGSVASGFGVQLATAEAFGTDTDPATPGIQLPTTLGGTTVSVKDSLGTARPASLFYVNPTQINYLIPDGTSAGTADLTITNGTGGISIGKVAVATVQPGIFSATSDGTGIASAQIQRVSGAVQTFEAIAQFTGGAWTAIPIDWKNATDDLYLVLYGTGVRNRSALSNVTATIGGGTALPTVYAGPQGAYPGVDQINLLLPRTLAGRNTVNVVLSADGKTANTVTINFK